MSLPNEIDFALIKMGDGASTEAFTIICGITDVTVNKSASTSDRFVRDCAKPGEVPIRKTRVSGKQLDITGSGLSNVERIEDLEDALGALKNYRVELYKEDGTDAGELLGTYAGTFRMTSESLSLPREGEASGEIALASDGPWTYTAAG